MKNNKHLQYNPDPGYNGTQGGPDIYGFSDNFAYLIYHKDCRALIGKANIVSRFDDWETICHNCKKVVPVSQVDQIKFVKISKDKPKD